MQLYYYHDAVGNFGDDLNPWLWRQLFPKPLETYFDDATLFIAIGSLLNHKIPEQPPKKIIFGSGYGYGDPPIVTDHWRFFCVRGPLTAQLLGLEKRLAICDSAILSRAVIAPSPSSANPVAFMPHHLTAKYDDWQSVCDALAIRYIDPGAPVAQTLAAIRTSSVLIAEAMHGAIIADALRVPWIPVRTRARIAEFKWHDWSLSLQIEHCFEWLPPAWKKTIDWEWKRRARPLAHAVARERLRWLARFGKRRLSRDAVFDAVYRRMRDAFQELIWAG